MFESSCRSNFRRQNTIDSASITQNTARLAAQNQRPASAQPKTTTESSKWSPADHPHLSVHQFFSFLQTRLQVQWSWQWTLNVIPLVLLRSGKQAQPARFPDARWPFTRRLLLQTNRMHRLIARKCGISILLGLNVFGPGLILGTGQETPFAGFFLRIFGERSGFSAEVSHYWMKKRRHLEFFPLILEKMRHLVFQILHLEFKYSTQWDKISKILPSRKNFKFSTQ